MVSDFILLIIQPVALILGTGSALTYYITYLQSGENWRKKYSQFLLLFSSYLLIDGVAIAIVEFFHVHWTAPPLIILLIAYVQCCIVITPILFGLISYIFNFTINRRESRSIPLILGAIVIVAVPILFYKIDLFPFVLCTIMLIMTILGLVLFLRKGKDKIQTKSKELLIFFYITITVLPLEFGEYVYKLFFFSIPPFPTRLFITPLYLILIGSIAIILSFKSLKRERELKKMDVKKQLMNRYQFTERESEVGELLLEGLTFKEIAAILFISKRTVDRHAENLYRKGDFKSKSDFMSRVKL